MALSDPEKVLNGHYNAAGATEFPPIAVAEVEQY